VSWTYAEGAANIADGLRRVVSRAKAPNYIIRTGVGSGLSSPVSAVAQDADPLSPTFVGGKYGVVPDPQSSPLITTQAQAQAAANAALRVALGTVEGVTVSAVAKPDHDVDDVIVVTRARSGLNAAKYVIDSFLFSFGAAGGLAITARSVTA
jgi:enamine deaminase RidA (YjgF/YER057c/UK114 family)